MFVHFRQEEQDKSGHITVHVCFVCRYLNYGAVGYIVGHKITHAFDEIGKSWNCINVR